MSKLRRIAEVGDGSYEQMMQKYASTTEDDTLDSAKRRKKKFASVSEQQIKPKNNWEELKGALRVSQKPFDADDYSSYDTSGRSVRRYESDDEEYETTFDPKISTAMTMHLYDDYSMENVKQSLAESAMRDAMRRESAMAHETKKLEQAQGWDQEQALWAQARLRGRNDEVVSSSSMKGQITKTANEQISASRFGQQDYDAMEAREIQLNAMNENMLQKHRSIKDSRIDITHEQKESQWANEENIRSQSIQSKMNNSKLFNNLANIIK